MDTKRFHVGTICTVAFDRLLDPFGISPKNVLLDFMLDGQLKKFGMELSLKECRLHLFDAFPWLKTVNHSGLRLKNLDAWLSAMEKIHGQFLVVRKIEPKNYILIPLAISVDDAREYGCPYCGAEFFPLNLLLWGGDCQSMLCPQCNRTYIVLYQGVTKSFLEILSYHPPLSPHPRRKKTSDPTTDVDMRIVGRVTT
ncbi:MAG: hypothetical protein HZC02_02610 [Candidatus Levybacteria bacterium]|nr:hypothetical protein [Candidatus Levybacteria bacterium]